MSPYSCAGRTCFAQGVGERISPVRLVRPRWYWLAAPPCQVPTSEIFSSSLLTRDSSRLTIRDFLADRDDPSPLLDPVSLVCRFRNDCERAAMAAYEPLRALWRRCDEVLGNAFGETCSLIASNDQAHKAACSTLRMTGTGSSLFIASTSERAIREVDARCAASGIHGTVVQGLDQSPAAAWASRSES